MAHFCYDPKSKLIPMDEVRAAIEAHVRPTHESEVRALENCMGLINSQNVVAPRNIPQHNNAGLDGFAVCGDPPENGHKIVGRIGAGDQTRALNSGEAVHINTGAPVPKDATAVVAIEECTVVGNRITPVGEPKLGAGIRLAGEDLKKDDIAIASGDRIDGSTISLAAALGLSSLSVYTPLKVGVLSSGSELVEAGAPLADGSVYDSNRPFLLASLKKWGFVAIDGGICNDNRIELQKSIDELASHCDCIITTAGASASDADFASALLDEHFDMILWRIALRPGRPFGFGFAQEKPIFVLPGNPIAVISTWSTLVKDALHLIQGGVKEEQRPILMTLGQDVSKKVGRTELYRMKINSDGQLVRSKAQGSGILSGVHQGDGFVILEHDDDAKKAGEQVPFYPRTYFF